MRPRFAVILINYRCVEDVARQLQEASIAGALVALVDNASEPVEVSRLAREHGTLVSLNDTNGGFAGGVNTGLRLLADAGHDGPVLLLNPDVHLTDAAMIRMLDEVDRGADGVSPQLRLGNGQLQVGVAGGPLTLWSVCVYFLGLAHVAPPLRGLFWTRSQARRGGSPAWLCAGCLLLSNRAVSTYGRWPEDEVVYAEDVAWGTRASKAGARFVLLSDVEVVHRAGGSGASSAWSGALERLCRRRLGRPRGTMAVIAIRLGIGLRRLLGRRIA